MQQRVPAQRQLTLALVVAVKEGADGVRKYEADGRWCAGRLAGRGGELEEACAGVIGAAVFVDNQGRGELQRASEQPHKGCLVVREILGATRDDDVGGGADWHRRARALRDDARTIGAGELAVRLEAQACAAAARVLHARQIEGTKGGLKQNACRSLLQLLEGQ